MKVFLVCGGRQYRDYRKVYEKLNELHAKVRITKIVHGCAEGADSYAMMWAHDHGIEEQGYPADWATHGKAAGHIRNKQMLDSERIDGVVAFPGGPGTANMVEQASKRGIVCWRIK